MSVAAPKKPDEGSQPKTFRIDPLAELSGKYRNSGPLRWEDGEESWRDVKFENLVLDVVKNTKDIPDLDVTKILLDGEIERTMEGASTISLTLWDSGSTILNSGALERAVDIQVDNMIYRLVAVNKRVNELELTFQDRIISYIQTHKKARSASRNKMTRLEFCLWLVRAVKKERIPVVVPELHKKQPIAGTRKQRKDENKLKQELKEPGFEDGAEVLIWHSDGRGGTRTRAATKGQIRYIERIIDEGIRLKASKKVIYSAVTTVMAETGVRNLPQGANPRSDATGLFQQIRQWGWPASRDVETDARAYYKAAMAIEDQYDSIGALGFAVQKAEPESKWMWLKAATYGKAAVDEYMGGSAAVKSKRTGSYRKRMMFSTKNNGKAEDYWEAIKRLLGDVGSVAFVSNGILYMISEEDLFRQKARMRISPTTPGVENIDFNYDVGKEKSTMTITARMSRWVAPPGSVVVVKDQGPADGRWLVASVRRKLNSRDGTIILKKPQEELPEPLTELVKREGGASDADTVSRGDLGDIPDDDRWGGTQIIFEKFINPFMEKEGLKKHSHKRAYDTVEPGMSDHYIGAKKSYAGDYPTYNGGPIALKFAERIGWKSYRNGTFDRVIIQVGNRKFTLQLLWAVKGHFDHIHVGLRRVSDTAIPDIKLNVSRPKKPKPPAAKRGPQGLPGSQDYPKGYPDAERDTATGEPKRNNLPAKPKPGTTMPGPGAQAGSGGGSE